MERQTLLLQFVKTWSELWNEPFFLSAKWERTEFLFIYLFFLRRHSLQLSVHLTPWKYFFSYELREGSHPYHPICALHLRFCLVWDLPGHHSVEILYCTRSTFLSVMSSVLALESNLYCKYVLVRLIPLKMREKVDLIWLC